MRGAVALCNGRIVYDFQSLRLKAWPFDGFLKSVSSTLVFGLECNANHYSTDITKNKRLKSFRAGWVLMVHQKQTLNNIVPYYSDAKEVIIIKHWFSS